MVKIKAVIPAAGFGTRFLPLTKAQPKEMLPVVDKPTIQWVVEEAIDAGITDILIITGRDKRSIEDHFDRSIEIEIALEKAGKQDQLENLKKVSEMANIHFIRQKTPRGLGDAVLCAKQHVGNSPFTVMLGDTICVGQPNCTKGLIDVFNKTNSSVFAVKEVKPEETKRYGILDGVLVEKDLWKVKNLVEKPDFEDAPSLMGILGRYLFTPEIFEHQKLVSPGVGGEIQLTDAMSSLAKKKTMHAWRFSGKRYDIGTTADWFKSHVELSLLSDSGEDYRRFLKKLI